MRTSDIRNLFVLPVLLFAFVPIAAGKTTYVDANAPGANNGTSWENAYNFLQDALADANSSEKPVEIRVAQGIYKPDQGAGVTPGDREATFQLKNGVVIKGGYAGYGEADPNIRDIGLYETILSGDIGIPGDNSDNSYNVVTGSGTDETAILDGLIITGGNANGPWPEYKTLRGGGMYNYSGSPTLTNCTLWGNSALVGGGIYNKWSNPILINCTFSNNSTTAYSGGGIYNTFSNPTLIGCIFHGNVARGGGGMFNSSSSPTLTRCAFIGNSVEYNGGGMANGGDEDECYPILTNCIFSGNCAEKDGGGIRNWWGDLTLINCTFTGNSAEGYGGGVDNHDNGRSTIINCTFAMNSAANGNALSCKSRPFSTFEPYACLTNCILWDGDNEIWDPESRVTVTYSDVYSGWPGEGNIDTDPCFVDPGYWDPNGTPDDPNDDFWVDGDYHLKSQSGRWDPISQTWVQDDVTGLCIDAGDPLSPIGFEPFPNGGIINMGAYGGTTEASKSYFGKPPCETIVAGDINGDCEVNFLDFRLMALHWCEDNNP